MSVTDDEMLSSVVERDIDLVFVQLIETAPEFRRWFIDQLDEEIEVDQYLGVRHSNERDSGESDIEIEIQTTTGESHIVLVENKIDASLQERQAERYFERGENYVANEGWDDHSVVLIAPANYVGDGERVKFGDVVLYEDLVDQIAAIDHDGSAFFRAMFRKATSKRPSRIDSYWTDEIARRFESKLDGLPPVNIYQQSNKQFRVESTQPEHPYHILYNVFFPGNFEGEKAVVRLNLTGRSSESISESDFETIQPILESQLDNLDQFESHDLPMHPVKTVLWRHNFRTDDEYVSRVIEKLVELITVYHPVFVQQMTAVTIEDGSGHSEQFDVYQVEEVKEQDTDAEKGFSQAGYWSIYGLKPSATELIPETFIYHSVPESLTSQGIDALQIVVIPKDSGFRVRTAD